MIRYEDKPKLKRNRRLIMQAIVYVRTDPGMALDILDEIAGIEGVKFTAAVTGRFDIITRVEVENLEELGEKVVEEIHNLDGVRYTETAPIVARA
ncbi:hypothetical protein AKJ48_03745 [candidate division MSBL1 archaeon SCGC-AAA261O19]|uniref:Transcription regulator AsnC/Lrp ligand binding domain-containing protein n=1 Tax=candidate division MSBL1 archaeon SCGC-AAA261O19 TaxID=1698277 RepID=A0A133VAW2_9EURY|nr:hypothetical protein AKJ48_03745 [candidate division MSBL1 archaeon SCGC-AAA261O19]